MAQVKISELAYFPGNARRGNLDIIKESLENLDQFRPIVVNRGTLAPNLKATILAGNHTCMAAQQLGWTHIDVHWVDVDEDTAKRIVLVDNAANDKSEYDVEALVNLATELPDLTATGFTRDELDAMLETLEDTLDELSEPDNEPEETYGVLVACDSLEQRETLKAQLMAKGYAVSNS